MTSVIELGPQHGLQQSVDYPLRLRLDAAWGVTEQYTAHMVIRESVTSEEVLARLTTGQGGITIAALDGGAARVTVLIDGDKTRTFDLSPSDETINGEDVPVLSTVATLILRNPDTGLDHPQALQFRLLWRASADREGDA